MTTKPLRGLLECPMHEGWIEFEFHQGDKISDLTTSIDAKWGNPTTLERFHYMRSAAWVFFCAQQNGEYLALRKGDPIPMEPPTASKPVVTRYSSDHLFYGDKLNVFFLDENLWNSSEDIDQSTPVEVTENFSIDLPFRRTYDIPADKQYDVRPVALVAIVGG